MRNRTTALVPALLCLALAGCGQRSEVADTSEPDDSAVDEVSIQTIYEAAVSNPARPEADRIRDVGRKPADVLEFFGIEPGMVVLDLFSGSGYYAEIIAHVVGSEGHVIAHTNSAYRHFVGDALAERFAGGRVENVDVLLAENNELEIAEDSVDAIMLIQSFHDIYHHADEASGWAVIEKDKFLAELRKGLRPGGIVGIVDHRGAAGVPAVESGNSVHRIDPAVVVADMEAAGFELSDETDLLANPDDDHSQSVFTEGIRGNTDRFVLAFRNPD